MAPPVAPGEAATGRRPAMSKEIVQREGGDVMGELGTGDAARAMDEFLLAVIDAASAARRRMAGGRPGATAPAEDFLSMAVAAGLPLRGYYTVAEVSEVTGIPKSTLYTAHREGLIEWMTPRGFERGAIVRPEDVDAYLGVRAS